MLDSIFNRLQTKLTNGLGRTQSAGAGHFTQVVNQNESLPIGSLNVQLNQPSIRILHPSTYFISSFNLTSYYLNQQFVNMNNSYQHRLDLNDGGAGHAQMGNPSDHVVSLNNTQMHQPTFLTYQPSSSVSFANNFNFVSPIDNRYCQILPPLGPRTLLVNQQIENKNEKDMSNRVNRQHSQSHKINSISSFNDFHEEEVGDDVSAIHTDNQNEGELYRSGENSRIEPTLPHHNGGFQEIVSESTKRKQTEQEEEELSEVNNRGNQNTEKEDDKEADSLAVKRTRQSHPTTSSSTPGQGNQLTTLKLRCPQLGCGLTFAHDKLLNKHLKERHSIDPFRCLVKDCAQSFTDMTLLDAHLSQSHQFTSQWHCGKCNHHFTLYQYLANHNQEFHQLGHFLCSYPACTFTGQYKMKVIIHFAQKHKPTLNCQHSGCQYKTQEPTYLKKHQQTHSGIKPYRCKWPECDYASTWKCRTIDHIKRMHLAQNPSSVSKVRDPCEFLDVLHELLRT